VNCSRCGYGWRKLCFQLRIIFSTLFITDFLKNFVGELYATHSTSYQIPWQVKHTETGTYFCNWFGTPESSTWLDGNFPPFLLPHPTTLFDGMGTNSCGVARVPWCSSQKQNKCYYYYHYYTVSQEKNSCWAKRLVHSGGYGLIKQSYVRRLPINPDWVFLGSKFQIFAISVIVFHLSYFHPHHW